MLMTMTRIMMRIMTLMMRMMRMMFKEAEWAEPTRAHNQSHFISVVHKNSMQHISF